MIKEAVAAIASTIPISADEGIQRDFSFYQHGVQLYSGGYGSGYASDAASVAANLRGTSHGFTAGQLEILGTYLLQGERWMIRGATFDHSARGRFRWNLRRRRLPIRQDGRGRRGDDRLSPRPRFAYDFQHGGPPGLTAQCSGGDPGRLPFPGPACLGRPLHPLAHACC